MAENDLLQGVVEPGFERVAEVFSENFSRHGDIGAACTVYRHGRPVVDLWGGLADPEGGLPWQQDTTIITFSVAKGLTATCVNRLIEAGQLDADRPVADYWPEFANRGKENITLRMVLGHRAGLAAVDAELSLGEVLAWDPVVAAIAGQEPNWEPGSQHGYHARSYGWILGEIVRRTTGMSLGQYLHREVCAPLDLHFWIGLPAEQLTRCATLIPPSEEGPSVADLLGENSLTHRVMSGPNELFSYSDMWNQPEVLQAEMPSSNGVGDARSLARFYSAVYREVDGVRLLGQEQLSRACEKQSHGPDAVILRDTCFGLGFALQPFLAPGAGTGAFGHPGAGGSVAFADPGADLSFAYVTNTMQFNLEGDARGSGLIAATYACL